NNSFGNVLKLPEHKIEKVGSAIPGLDGRKMSKSYDNHIPLFIDEKKRRKLIMKIVTDSKLPEEPKVPEDNTIYQLYTHFATDAQIKEMHDAFIKGGMGYGDAKKLLAEAVEVALKEPSEKYTAFMADTDKLDVILAEGAEKARKIARQT